MKKRLNGPEPRHYRSSSSSDIVRFFMYDKVRYHRGAIHKCKYTGDKGPVGCMVIQERQIILETLRDASWDGNVFLKISLSEAPRFLRGSLDLKLIWRTHSHRSIVGWDPLHITRICGSLNAFIVHTDNRPSQALSIATHSTPSL